MLTAMEWLAGIVAAAAGGVVAVLAVARASRRRADAIVAAARAEAAALRKAAELDAAAALKQAETTAREEGLRRRAAALREVSAKTEELARREERVAKREAAALEEHVAVTARLDAVREREREVQSRQDRAKNSLREAEKLAADFLAALEQRAGTTAAAVKSQLSEAWIEEARAEAAHRVRLVDQSASDPEHARNAKRIMGIAAGRYRGHYLTERLLSTVAIPPGFAEVLARNDAALLHAMTEVTGVKLEIHDSGEKVRLDSADGVAREIVRRALAKLIKGTAPRDAESDPRRWVRSIAAQLDREIVELGRKAFAELEIPRAHPEIVKLVGRLNWRTSYTQNQWKHALEASFLGGMMAAELGLDVKLARRATLMHDIGKSLSHEIEGSHAVIGADYARRLGEDEIVANAIGAHHADEPPNSVYAYLVAAADAMSGARPGARREQSEQYATRLEDLERIGASFRGVDRAFAVQGGREVRVYVKEDQVDDLRAVALSSQIAAKISDELVFPGQIKVTVIRQVEAVEVAN